MKTAVVPDTNVFIYDPNAIDHLKQEGYFIYLPWAVILELDNLKAKQDVGMDAREALRNIENALEEKNGHILVFRKPDFANLSDLDKKKPDHQIIATAKTVPTRYKGAHKKVKILSRDRPVRILANELNIVAEDYIVEQGDKGNGSVLKTINVGREEIGKDGSIPVQEKHGDVVENEGVICYSDYDPFHAGVHQWGQAFAAIKKGGHWRLIPNDIEVMGVKPYSLNGDGYNWFQHIAISQLQDPKVQLCLLQGGAGTGKTVLALASAIAQRRSFRRIVVTRPMVPLEDEDKMGFIPGDEDKKMGPWLHPIWQSLDFLKDQGSSNKKLIEQMQEERKIDFAPLDYIRGMNFYKDVVVLDDSQNLTPHQVKTIITRIGKHSKLICTGDLGQIDRKRRLDRRSSGLACAADRLRGSPLVAVTKFKETVRSPLSALAEEYM